MLQPLSWRRGGAVALVVLIVVAGAALVLDSGAASEFTPVIERLQEQAVEPGLLVEQVARGAQIVILGDVAGKAAPKRMAAQAIERLSREQRLDAVLLEVPASEQRYIDAYLGATKDDASMLLSRPAAVQEQQGQAREYLRIYQAVREANQGLNASQRIRIIAAGVEDWPPPEGVAPRDIGEIFARRAPQMLDRLDRELFSIMPDARVLAFVDGYQALQGTYGEIRSGGGDPVRVEWLGELLRRRSGSRTRTILPDMGSSADGMQQLPTYRGTRLHRPLRRALKEPGGTRIRGEIADVQDAVEELSTPGMSLEILPVGYRFDEVAQGYVFLPGGR